MALPARVGLVRVQLRLGSVLPGEKTFFAESYSKCPVLEAMSIEKQGILLFLNHGGSKDAIYLLQIATSEQFVCG